MQVIAVPETYREIIHVEASENAVRLRCEDASGQVWRASLSPTDAVVGVPDAVQSEIVAAWTPERIAAYNATVVVLPDLPPDGDATDAAALIAQQQAQIAALEARIAALEA